MHERYNPAEIEPRWQKRWADERAFSVGDATGKDDFYLLEMLPYPSGRIHMGHVRNYSLGDVFVRHLRMRGKNVLHPMGWDAFGMPAENAAIERKRHPRDWTYENIAQMREQIKKLGFSYDWDREIATCDASYYKHEQAMFLRMLEAGVAYRKAALANFCDHCQTVLANEQVEEGKCWRCGNNVRQREMQQWFLRTTKYAQELLDGHKELEGKWPEQVLTMQRNWIGRSTGAEIRFALKNPVDGVNELSVFTTRPDTLFGVTFLSIAAEHPLATRLAAGTPREKEVQDFADRIRAERRVRHDVGEANKEGVFTGATCLHPITGAEVPIYVANFVLMDYGTGAVMAVPAHDQRDFEFAQKYKLPIRVVIQPEGAQPLDPATMTAAYVEGGFMVNSGSLDGTLNEIGKEKVVALLAEKNAGRGTISYRLRDWLVSRQRYWGAPIPVIHCETDGVVPVPQKDLPVVLPEDVEITGEGGSPLARHESFVNVSCPKCGKPARRETDTFDTFVESSWYFDRYTTPRHEAGPVDGERARNWLPIDLYIGGIEHAVMHLLYARFWQRVMIDLGYFPKDTPREPFAALLTQGMVCKEFYHRQDALNPAHTLYFYPEETELREGTRVVIATGEPVEIGGVVKMSKSKRNIVDPDEIVSKYGADSARLFVLFAAPPEAQVDWSEAGIEGASRFLQRVWRMIRDRREMLLTTSPYTSGELSENAKTMRRTLHKIIDRVTRDLGERRQPNTGVAAMMELLNALTAFEAKTAAEKSVLREGVDALVRLLAPFAPHIADELHEHLGGKGTLLHASWPAFDADAVHEDSVEIPVQVNGKVRGRVRLANDANEATALAAAQADANVAAHLQGKTVKKTIYIAGKILTLVAV
ncbi:MAG: leucine--tRNA ligase [Sandaracinaceae bacterium]|nr:leucine--tRNA ligase [Sandaracinaceae bacterium]